MFWRHWTPLRTLGACAALGLAATLVGSVLAWSAITRSPRPARHTLRVMTDAVERW